MNHTHFEVSVAVQQRIAHLQNQIRTGRLNEDEAEKNINSVLSEFGLKRQ